MITGINGFGSQGLFQNAALSSKETAPLGEGDSIGSTHPGGWDGVNKGGSVSSEGGMLSMTDFYTLLAAQLRYQDADNPMDTSEMMAQMVQSQMIQTITQLSEVTVTTYAASMAGKEVTVAELDAKGNYTGKNTVGVVESVVFSGSTPAIFVNGKAYSMSQLMAIGKIPEAEEPGDGEGSGEAGNGEGTGEVGNGEGTGEVGNGEGTGETQTLAQMLQSRGVTL